MREVSEVPEYCSRGYAEINLDAITDNMRNMKANIAPDTKMIGVIKTDGYGHGSLPIAKELENYMQELTSDMIEMVEGSTQEEKQYLSKRIAALANKIQQLND